MPELPEVDSIARSLRRGNGKLPLPGQRIVSVSIQWPRHIAEPSVSSFRRRIRDRLIQDVKRRGKYVVFPLDQDTLLIHLRMSGDLQLVDRGTSPGRFDRTVFHLDSGQELRFSDSRKLGKVYLLEDPEQLLNKLGPEPLDANFTPQVLTTRLSKHRRAIKSLMLDQSFIAGLGNIYTDEALYLAKLHPLRRSDSLNSSEITALWHGIRDALHQGILHNGASIDWVYRGGTFQNFFHVYQRTGESCLECGTCIQRTVVSQRGTYFCPSCQPEVSP